MNEEQRDTLFDLLTEKAVYGLDENEQGQLDQLDDGNLENEFLSLEMTAAAIGMAGLTDIEPMPEHLQDKISADAQSLFAATDAEPAVVDTTTVEEPSPDAAWPPIRPVITYADENPGGSIFGWMGWAAAATACVALAINLWFTQPQPVEQAGTKTPAETPRIFTPTEMREQLLNTTPNMVRAEWAAGNVAALKQIAGDVVWSDEKQAGYMRFRGLPVNDTQKETYQLWIFDQTQDSKTPIDGGTFDVDSDGEVVIPINAKLKARGPSMFAVTIEKPGGVVVSDREKIAALAKVETKAG